MGLNVKLDVGLYRLDQQVACQRYRQNLLDANLKDRVASAIETGRNYVATLFATPVYATV
jgi:hypothetical protein